MGKLWDALEKAKRENLRNKVVSGESIPYEVERDEGPLAEVLKITQREVLQPGPNEQIPIVKQAQYPGKKSQPRSVELSLPIGNLLPGGLPDKGLLTGEAYRHLRTILLRTVTDNSMKSLLILSAKHREGKTATAINLALAITNTGRYRVLLVESDLRYPDIYPRLGLEQSQGLAEILQGRLSLDSAIKDTAIENLKVITSGILPSHPAELLESKKLKDSISEAKNKFDTIIFDSPPFLLYTDANILSSIADSFLLVIEAAKTSRKDALQVVTRLQNNPAKVLVAILNKQRHGFPKRAYRRMVRPKNSPES